MALLAVFTKPAAAADSRCCFQSDALKETLDELSPLSCHGTACPMLSRYSKTLPVVATPDGTGVGVARVKWLMPRTQKMATAAVSIL